MSRTQENVIERRLLPIRDLEVRAAVGDEPATIRGYAAVFDVPSEDLGGFREIVRPGAFETASESDVRALWNHDSNFVLGRNVAGTLALTEDEDGLRVLIEPPGATWADDLLVSMRRGDVDQMSFGFRTLEDFWRRDADGQQWRELVSVELFDVSIVTYPAYPQTSAEARAMVDELNGRGQETGPEQEGGQETGKKKDDADLGGDLEGRMAMKRRRLDILKLRGGR